MIDTAYDGQTFNIALTDVPERKDDLVEGSAAAVKVTDMLGEEMLVVKEA